MTRRTLIQRHPEAAPAAPPDRTWDAIAALVGWLDATNGDSAHETAMRILKISEEVGEVAEAYGGMTGQNPRKGVTHTAGDVADELCDVALTALVALHRFCDSPEDAFRSRVARVAARVGVAPIDDKETSHG